VTDQKVRNELKKRFGNRRSNPGKDFARFESGWGREMAPWRFGESNSRRASCGKYKLSLLRGKELYLRFATFSGGETTQDLKGGRGKKEKGRSFPQDGIFHYYCHQGRGVFDDPTYSPAGYRRENSHACK